MATIARLPLTGYRVLVTRARSQAGPLMDRLEQLGAIPIELPAIEIVPADPAPLDAAIRNLASYDWIVFTSANGVSSFIDRLHRLHPDGPAMAGVRIAAIGHATNQRLLDVGIVVDLVPDRFDAESIVDELEARSVVGQGILLPQADIARDTVAEGLRRAGAVVDDVVAYRTVLPGGLDSDEVQRLIASVDFVTFASPSAIRNVLTMAGDELPQARVICIGPVTADAARAAGLKVAAVADPYTSDGLVDAIVQLVDRAQEEGSDDRRTR